MLLLLSFFCAVLVSFYSLCNPINRQTCIHYVKLNSAKTKNTKLFHRIGKTSHIVNKIPHQNIHKTQMYTQSPTHDIYYIYVTQFVREETNTKNVNSNYIRINFTWMCVSFYCKQISTNIHNKMCKNSFFFSAFVSSVYSSSAHSLSCAVSVPALYVMRRCCVVTLPTPNRHLVSHFSLTSCLALTQQKETKRRTIWWNSSKQNEFACFFFFSFISVAYVWCVCAFSL